MKSATYFFPLIIIIASLSCLSHYRSAFYLDDVTLWQETISKSPNKARTHNELGVALKEAHDFAGAQLHYERTLELQPNHRNALHNLSNIFIKMGRTTEAMTLIRKTLLLDPKFIPARYNLAMQYYEHGSVNDAAREYAAIIQQNPFCAEAAFAGQMLRMIQTQKQTR